MIRQVCFLFWLPVLLAAGCAESKNEAVVTGTVKVDGEPAKTGAMTFIPVDGMSSTAGAMITDGQYTAKVPIGTMKVQITVSKVVGEQRLYDTPDSPVMPLTAEVLLPKYSSQNTELRLEVKPGENREDYDLKSE